MTFPEKLKSERKRLGMTQPQAAKTLSASPRAIWKWEKSTPPHVLMQEGALARLAKLERVKPNETKP